MPREVGQVKSLETAASGSRVYTRRQALGAGVTAVGGIAVGGGLLSAFLTACANSSTQTSGSTVPKRGGILHLGVGSFDATEVPDPARGGSETNMDYDYLVYDSLTLAQKKTLTLAPSLALTWESTPDVTQWTFHLRSGVKFHDGTPFTARDAAWSLTRMLDPKLGALHQSRLAPSLDPSGVQVIDDLTLVLKLKRPDADLPWVLGNPATQIVKNGTAPIVSAQQAIGTGPFKSVSYTAGQSFEVTRNDNYWGQVPYLDGVRANLFAEPTTLLAAIQSGTIDVTPPLSASALSTLNGNSAVQLLGDKNAWFFNIPMDPQQKPFTDPNVTRAFKLAVDRKKILQTVFQGRGTVTPDCPLAPDSPVFPKGLGSGAQDVAQAKALLSAAGYPNGIDIQIKTAPQVEGMVDLASALADTMKDAGIRLSVQVLSNHDYGAEVGPGTLMYIDFWSVLDPLQILSNDFLTGAFGNESKLSNSQLDSAVSQALGTTDAATRDGLLSQAFQLAAQNASQIIPATLDNTFAVARNVHGVRPTGLAYNDFSKAWIG